MNNVEKNQVNKLEKPVISQPEQQGNGDDWFRFESLTEFVAEEVPETALGSSGQSHSQDGAFPSKKYTFTQKQLREKLLASRPTENQMKRELSYKLKKQMKFLKGKARKLLYNLGSAFELASVVSKMREIQELFYYIAHATYDVLRRMWLRLVHGIY